MPQHCALQAVIEDTTISALHVEENEAAEALLC